ncbi:MAG TPA: hypothetical protein VI423_02140 [Paenisporosarcina sp.]|nr:hypothetical protein [Paenisporosarcina sp.]
MQVTLKKDGFYYLKSKVEDKNILHYWTDGFDIEKDVYLKDLFLLLQRMDPSTIDIIQKLTNSNISGFLKAWDPDNKAASNLKYIEVYRIIDVDNYLDVDNPDVTITMSAHGIGDAWKETLESEGEKQNCDSYAIEFSDWNELSHLELRLRPAAFFTEKKWTKTGEKKPYCFDENGDSMFESDMELVSSEHRELQTEYTLGEFLNGLFSELCFFMAPEERDEQLEIIRKRVDSIKDVS